MFVGVFGFLVLWFVVCPSVARSVICCKVFILVVVVLAERYLLQSEWFSIYFSYCFLVLFWYSISFQ